MKAPPSERAGECFSTSTLSGQGAKRTSYVLDGGVHGAAGPKACQADDFETRQGRLNDCAVLARAGAALTFATVVTEGANL